MNNKIEPSPINSKIVVTVDKGEKVKEFELIKSPCGIRIVKNDDFLNACHGKSVNELLKLQFYSIKDELNVEGEEAEFNLYIEWISLKATLAKYLGIDCQDINKDICEIESIEHDKDAIIITAIIFPPNVID